MAEPISSVDPSAPPRLGAWRFVAMFGTISLLADVVYEGARSITGPLLASLGATGLVVGLVTGVGEAAALALRLVSGPLADRTRRLWAWTIAGYTLTVVTVPLLGLTAALWVACALVICERVGKAVRSPAKDTMLSHATHVTGRGRGFAVHKALDQVGAVLGPLSVAAVLALTGDDFAPALGLLALPGVATLALLFWLRARVPAPERYEPDETSPATVATAPRPRMFADLPTRFWAYGGFVAATVLGSTTFGLLSFHMVTSDIVATAAVPLVYAAAMGAGATAALLSGWAYDRAGPVTLILLPVLSAGVALLGFTAHVGLVIAAAMLWGGASGIQDSTMRAVVADLVAPARRATAYGVFAAGVGAAIAAGGALTGLLYDESVPALIGFVVVVQLAALVAVVALPWRRR